MPSLVQHKRVPLCRLTPHGATFSCRSGLGFGSLAAGFLINASELKNPLAARKPMFPATAKSVIFLFMHGGPSHLETFDPKPLLEKLNGQPVPDSFGDVQLQFSTFKKVPILASRRKFRAYGQAGIEVSDVLPAHCAACR